MSSKQISKQKKVLSTVTSEINGCEHNTDESSFLY